MKKLLYCSKVYYQPYLIKQILPNIQQIPYLPITNCFFSTTTFTNAKLKKQDLLKLKEEQKSFTEKRKAERQSPIISLYDTEGKMTVTTLIQAERLAKRRLLKLIPYTDVESSSKSDRSNYKLITSKEYTEGHLWTIKNIKPTSSYMKGEKRFTIGHRLTDQHLDVKLKSILQCLAKTKQAKVVITGKADTETQQNKVFDVIKKACVATGAKVGEVQTKGFDYKFDINPPRPTTEEPQSTDPSSDIEEKPRDT